MCGIFGYIGSETERNSQPLSICLEGLKNLEYRGYDSSGIASMDTKGVKVYKTSGKIELLEKLLSRKKAQKNLAIGHTRWATHGKPSKENAHPHFDNSHKLALVHNGIIENFSEMKQLLISKNITFSSDTDTEIIAQLISYHDKGDVLKALKQTLKELTGSFAIAFIHKDYPNKIFAASRDSPLAIGFNQDRKQAFLSSDPNALRKYDLNISFLHDNEIAILDSEKIEVFDLEGQFKEKKKIKLDPHSDISSKCGYEHFMLKEIHEQPTTIKQALNGRLEEDFGTAHFKELNIDPKELQSIHRILILACGSSFHAGLVAKSLFESISRIPTEVEIASEFRYSNPIISEDTLVIAISQSGETADTLAAMKEAKAKGAKILGFCNVTYSTLTRESDHCLFLNAGPEISVCSTKAFTSQLTLLTLFTIYMARLRHLSKEEGIKYLTELKKLPYIVESVLRQSNQIQALAKKYAIFNHFFFLGRRYMYPASLEAALKLKEISYVFASAYASGEMKHGPIALIDNNLLSVVMGGNIQTFEKLQSNIQEIKARDGKVLAFLPESSKNKNLFVDDAVYLPEVSDELAPIPYSVAAQLLAYYIAKEKGTDIDKPRNLAKSVTVE